MARPQGIVEAVPINSVDERADRARTLLDLDAWKAENPGLEAIPLGPDAS